jgi:hypothetical protein
MQLPARPCATVVPLGFMDTRISLALVGARAAGARVAGRSFAYSAATCCNGNPVVSEIATAAGMEYTGLGLDSCGLFCRDQLQLAY